MASGNQSAFVASIVLDIVHHVARYLLIAIRNRCTLAQGLKGLITNDLVPLQFLGLGPLIIAVLFVYPHGLLMVWRDLVATRRRRC